MMATAAVRLVRLLSPSEGGGFSGSSRRSLSFSRVDESGASGVLSEILRDCNASLGGCSIGRGFKKAALGVLEEIGLGISPSSTIPSRKASTRTGRAPPMPRFKSNHASNARECKQQQSSSPAGAVSCRTIRPSTSSTSASSFPRCTSVRAIVYLLPCSSSISVFFGGDAQSWLGLARSPECPPSYALPYLIFICQIHLSAHHNPLLEYNNTKNDDIHRAPVLPQGRAVLRRQVQSRSEHRPGAGRAGLQLRLRVEGRDRPGQEGVQHAAPPGSRRRRLRQPVQVAVARRARRQERRRPHDVRQRP